MSVFRFDKVLGLARSVRAFLSPKSAITGGVLPDDRHREDRAKKPKKNAGRSVPEHSKKIKSQRQELKNKWQELSQINTELHTVKEQTERISLEERGKKIRHEIRRLKNERDPPLERLETAHLRQLPKFVIIGTTRGGTTSLYHYLTAHPDVGPALRKEVHFFDRFYEKGINWYLAHFPMQGEVPVAGEASPSYLHHPDVPQRAREVVPHAKLIALLRNPVDRAYSHYSMNLRKGSESLAFEEVIDRELEWLSNSGHPGHQRQSRRYSYVERGLYMDFIKRWMDFFPREQLLVIKSEDFYENTGRVLGQTLKYLGLRPWNLTGFKAHHLSEYAAGVDPAMRKRLLEYFAPYNQQLYAFLGRDLGWEHE